MRIAVMGLAAMVLLGIAVLAAACGGGETGAPTATPVPATAPPDRTGIGEVDAVIDAVLSGDAEALRPLLRFVTGSCVAQQTDPSQAGQPLCPPDEAEGTAVDFLPETVSGQCRIAVRTLQVLSNEIGDFMSSLAGSSLYAVYRSTPAAEKPPRYTVVFARSDPEAGYPVVGARLAIEDGRVVSVNIHCATTLPELLEGVQPADLLLAPRPLQE